MITFPPEFTATKYPGYFWCTKSKRLFSIKVGGVLKPIKKIHPNRFNHIQESGYQVSHKGFRKFLPMSYLLELKIEDSEIQVNDN